MFWLRNKKIIFSYALLSWGLHIKDKYTKGVYWSRSGVVDKPLTCKAGVTGMILGFSSLFVLDLIKL